MTEQSDKHSDKRDVERDVEAQKPDGTTIEVETDKELTHEHQTRTTETDDRTEVERLSDDDQDFPDQ